MINSKDIRQALRLFISRTPGVLVVMFLTVILYLNVAGFPDWLTSRIMMRINSSGNFVLNPGVIRLAPLHMELILENVRGYRKKVLGPAAIEAKQIVVGIDAAALMKKKFFLRRIRVVDGTISPKLCYGPDVSVRSPSDREGKLTFIFELENCLIQGINVVSLSADLNIEGDLLTFNNIGGILKRGDMSGDVSGQLLYNDKDGILDGRLITQLDPRLLIPLIKDWDMPMTADLVSRFDFHKQPPKCEVTFRKFNKGSGDFILDGKYAMQESSYRGVEMMRANGAAHVELVGSNALVRVEVAELVRKEGTARTTFTADLVKQTVSFDGMSSIHAPYFFQMVNVFTNECRQYFSFKGPVRIAASGVVDYGGFTNTNFKGIVETEKMGIGPLMTESCSFAMTMVGFTTTVTGIKGKIYGGDFSGSTVLVLPENTDTNVLYSVDANVENADFHKVVTALLDGYEKKKYTGKIGGRAKVSGILGAGNSRTAVGNGYVSIKKGHIFTLPVFGGLTEFMMKYVPGVDFVLAQTDARADFSILDGKATSREILVEGGVITLSGIGDYHLDKQLDFKVKVKLLKKKTLLGQIIQFVTDPISELFEFKLKGTLDQPEWSSQHL